MPHRYGQADGATVDSNLTEEYSARFPPFSRSEHGQEEKQMENHGRDG